MGKPNFQPGQIVKFTYRHLRMDENTGDPYKEVLVLHPGWMGKMHGIDIKRLTAAEREVLQAIFNPEWKTKRHKLALVNDILRRMDPVEDVKNPLSFYNKFVRVFLQNKDAYRQYFPYRMSGVTIVKATSVRGTVFNPKPLFKKPGSKSSDASSQPEKELTPQQKQSRLDAIKKAATKLFGKKGEKLTKQPNLKPVSPQERLEFLKKLHDRQGKKK